MEIFPWLLKWWPLASMGAIILLNAGGWTYVIRDMRRQIVGLREKDSQIEADIRARLYDEKSQPIYAPLASCLLCRQDCERQRIREYDRLNTQLAVQNDKLDRLLERGPKA